MIISMLLTGGVSTLYGATPERGKRLNHSLSVELRPAYNTVRHYVLNVDGTPLGGVLSLHAKYGFSFSEHSRLGELFPTTYQGIGLATYTFSYHDLIGTPLALYIFQGARIADLSERLSLGYEWSVGYSWGWHPNDAMAARQNITISLALPLIWRVDSHWELSLTPDYTHFSNGDTHFSNAGANIFGLRLGAKYLFTSDNTRISARRFISPSEEYISCRFAERMTHDILAYGGFSADRFREEGTLYVVDKPLPTVGISFQPSYHFNRYFALGASLDMQFDSSLNLYDGTEDEMGNTSFSRPPLWQQLEVGISARGEISAPIFTLGIGFGINILRYGYDSSPFYTTFSLKAHITKHLMLLLGYRFNSIQYTHNLTYGIGFRF